MLSCSGTFLLAGGCCAGCAAPGFTGISPPAPHPQCISILWSSTLKRLCIIRPAHSTSNSQAESPDSYVPDFQQPPLLQQATWAHSPGFPIITPVWPGTGSDTDLAALEGSSGAARSSPRSERLTLSVDVFYLSLPICSAGHRLPGAEDS